eukprot:1160599-Pelagomonas_calceolata.AAC.21
MEVILTCILILSRCRLPCADYDFFLCNPFLLSSPTSTLQAGGAEAAQSPTGIPSQGYQDQHALPAERPEEGCRLLLSLPGRRVCFSAGFEVTLAPPVLPGCFVAPILIAVIWKRTCPWPAAAAARRHSEFLAGNSSKAECATVLHPIWEVPQIAMPPLPTSTPSSSRATAPRLNVQLFHT